MTSIAQLKCSQYGWTTAGEGDESTERRVGKEMRRGIAQPGMAPLDALYATLLDFSRRNGENWQDFKLRNEN